MFEFIVHSIWAQLSLAMIVVLLCGVVAWFVPPLRRLAVEVGALVLAAATIYGKGVRDRARLEQERKDAAVKRNQEEFKKIDARPDTPDDVDKRLRDGRF